MKKRLREGKLHCCSRTPVQPVSAMSGVGAGVVLEKDGRGVMKVIDSGEMGREISVSVRFRVRVWVR